jgi:hypothetical protein
MFCSYTNEPACITGCRPLPAAGVPGKYGCIILCGLHFCRLRLHLTCLTLELISMAQQMLQLRHNLRKGEALARVLLPALLSQSNVCLQSSKDEEYT